MNTKQRVQAAVSGFTGKVGCHYVAYLGDGHVHRNVPYNANSPSVLSKIAELIKLDGFDLVVATWLGPWATACHQNAISMCMKCQALGMGFALLLDPGGMKKWAGGLTQAQITANVASALSDPGTQAMLNSDAYLSPKYVLDFNTGASLPTLAAAFPNLTFLAQGSGFSWISIPNISNSVARNAAAVANLKAQHANPAMVMASFCESFDDSGMPLPAGVQSQTAFDAAGGTRDLSQSAWGGPARILEGFEGQFANQQLATINPATPIVMRITWNDVDEQTDRERVVADEQGVDWTKV